MITRKALVAKLKAMNLDNVLIPWQRRASEAAGSYRGYDAEKVLIPLLEVPHMSQRNFFTKRGCQKENPKWLKQLYTDIAWSSGDITPGSILQAIS